MHKSENVVVYPMQGRSLPDPVSTLWEESGGDAMIPAAMPEEYEQALRRAFVDHHADYIDRKSVV